jgi:GTP diphosphokinase / guanosine-3',5'-bis(diphosphate) 3'-diphosphatase
MLSEITDQIKAYLPNTDISLIDKAYNFSKNAHSGQLRASGEEYFTHCEAAALILTELKLDIETVSAALLHDVLEDTKTSKEELLIEFGADITSLVESVTKISSYHFADQEMAQAENWRKMLLAVTKDIRVILIKFADRLHNLRTIRYLPEETQKKIASETLYLYAPFAQRLGIYKWKSEFEDLSFKILYSEKYDIIASLWQKQQEKNILSLQSLKQNLTDKLSPHNIPLRISARPKSLYGTYKKMERQHKEFSEIQDLLAFRIITDSIPDCYALLGFVHSYFKPVPGSFTDYISLPKINMYQSLHTSIFDEKGNIAEIQIRTEEMHRRSEYGIAAHWRYKEGGAAASNAGLAKTEDIEEKLDWLKEVLEWQNDLKDPKEFLNALKSECKFEQIFVFTPKGRVIKLPGDSTPVDFAYCVHTDIGNHCYGAKVGGKLVPLDFKLKSGFICEILTRKNSNPTKDWLEFVITARARSKIRRYLKAEEEKTRKI